MNVNPTVRGSVAGFAAHAFVFRLQIEKVRRGHEPIGRLCDRGVMASETPFVDRLIVLRGRLRAGEVFYHSLRDGGSQHPHCTRVGILIEPGVVLVPQNNLLGRGRRDRTVARGGCARLA